MTEKEVTKTQEMIYELLVREVMTKRIITVKPSTPMRNLRGILKDNRISGTPVIEKNEVVGIVSIEDFINWLSDGGPDCLVSERMTKDIKTVYDDDRLIRVVEKLERSGFGRLPVLRRDNGRLVGVITKGDIIGGLLKKLEVDYQHVEMRRSRSSHIFEDLQADRSKLVLEYGVRGTDFADAGTTATKLKTSLRRVGIDPQITRRTAIAAYEAEMNVVFFTKGGYLAAEIEPEIIRLIVEDKGPGIPDIEKAMQPGYSTAPEWVRELGFGAGMGLPNIKKCSDRMRLDSTVGKGTRLEVEFFYGRKK